MRAPTIRRARPDDAVAILRLRDAAADWLVRRGIRQWQVGEVSHEDVLVWLTTGRVYVADLDGQVVGSVRVAWDDASVWGRQAPDAGYIQALVGSRAPEGRGVGRELLAYAEGVIARSGRTVARLSCQRGNTGLEAFYTRCGYREVGSSTIADTPDREPVTRFEKGLDALS